MHTFYVSFTICIIRHSKEKISTVLLLIWEPKVSHDPQGLEAHKKLSFALAILYYLLPINKAHKNSKLFSFLQLICIVQRICPTHSSLFWLFTLHPYFFRQISNQIFKMFHSSITCDLQIPILYLIFMKIYQVIFF